LPGLLIAVLGVLAGVVSRRGGVWISETYLLMAMLALPWLVLAAYRRRPAAFGCYRRRALPYLGWGAFAGAAWRGVSMLLHFWTLSDPMALAGGGILAWALTPLVEETFFRGYLARGLSRVCGWRLAVLLQAVLFALQPAHVHQGWLTIRTGSLWPAVGAHVFANLMPDLLLLLSGN
jgi:membrane protease YdiL (CAAX protease family)